MSTVVDERVVEMRFDNKQFESGVKETMGTLDRLKQALNLSTSRKSIDNLDKAVQNVSFEGMARGIAAIERRFSTLGIVGMRVVQNLTDTMMSQFGRATSFVEQSVVSGGIRRAMNIENAHFQLQALLKDEEKVQAVMNDAMDAVDGTAYGFDEAAKAASQFAASGLQAGEDMQRALKGITGVTAMTNREFGEIATIFTTVAGNGRLMGDQLLQLSDRGLNAASTLKDYFVEVKGLTGTTEQDIREMVTKGKLDFKTFADAMGWAFGDSAKRANETFQGSLSNIKAALARIGAEFVSPLIEQNSEVVRLFNAIKDRINDVKSTLTFNEEIGNTEALSNQFTTTVLSMAKAAADFMENADITGPMTVFYNTLESIKNSGKGVLSVVKPITQALRDAFGMPTIDDMISLSDKIEDITYRMRLTEKQSENLQTTFKGIFDVVAFVRDGVLKMFQAFLPAGSPVVSLADQFLELTSSGGKALTLFTRWVRNSPIIENAYNKVSGEIHNAMDALSSGISNIDDFVKSGLELPEVQSFLSGIARVFNTLGTVSAPYLNYLSRKIIDFRNSAEQMIPESLNSMLSEFIKFIGQIGNYLNTVDLSKPTDWFKKFGDTTESLLDTLSGNKGLTTFLTNMRQFFSDLASGFSFDKVKGKITGIKDTIGGFISWIQENLGPLFSNASVGGLIAGSGGIGMVVSILKMSKALEKATSAFSSFTDPFKEMGDVLKTYQKELNSEAIKNIAISIGILAGSLVVLSFADPKRLMVGAIALGTVGSILLVAINKFRKARNKITTIPDVLNTLAKGLSNSIKQFGKAKKWEAIGGAFKSFGLAIAMIVGSIAALAKLNEADPENVRFALEVVTIIAGVLTSIMLIMSLIGEGLSKGMKGFKAAADGMKSLSLSMAIAIGAMSALMKMDIPGDYKKRLEIFAGLFAGMTVLAVALSLTAKEKGKKASISAFAILSLAVLLRSVVGSLDKLFKMDLPEDWRTKVGILAGIFAGMVVLIGSLGKATGESGKVKATGTLIALALDIAAIVTALMILSIMPAEGLIKGALALSIVLLSLSKSLSSMTGVDKNTYKTVLSMAIMVGAIVAALGILSMISGESLIKSGAALGSMLIALALDLVAAGKISGDGSWKTIAALVAETAAIALSLYFLADKPWDSLLAAAGSLGLVLLSIGTTMLMIGKMDQPSVEKLGTFLLGVMAIIPIGYAINQLAQNPWESLLASGTAISEVLLSIGATMIMVGHMEKPNIEAMGMFLEGVLAVLLIADPINQLAQNPWESLLASGTAISEVLLSMGAVMAICSKIGKTGAAALEGIGILDLLIIDLTAIFTGIGALMDQLNLIGYLEKGIEVMGMVGEAIGSFVGGIVDGFVNKATESFEDVGTRLSNFMTNLEPFLTGVSNLDTTTLDNSKTLLDSLTSTASSITSLWNFFQTVDIPSFVNKITELGDGIVIFSNTIGDIDPDDVAGAQAAADVLGAIVNAIPKQGGLSQLIFGEKDLGDFGNQMLQLGVGLKNFAQNTEGITTDSVSGAAGAIEVLSALSDGIPSTGLSFVSAIVGQKDLGDFGEQLEVLGGALSSFVNSTSGIDKQSVEGAASATELLIDIANSMEKSGGLWGGLSGNKSLKKFGKELESFGESLSVFSEKIQNVSVSKISSVASAMSSLVDVASKLSGNEISSMSSFTSGMSSLGNSGIENLASSISSGTNSVVKAVNTMLAKVIATLGTKVQSFRKAGSEMSRNFISGVNSKLGDAGRSGTSLGRAVLTNCRNTLSSMYEIGKNGSEGFIRGFRSNMAAAQKAGKDIAKATSNSTKGALDESSPSKLMFKIGDFAGLGYLNGLIRYIEKARQAGSRVGESSMDGINDAIRMGGSIYDELFTDPVITPVVDSSKVFSAASDIDKLMNRSVALQAYRLSGFNISSNNEIKQLTDAIKTMNNHNKAVKTGNTYTIGNISYQEGSDVGDAFKSLMRAIRLEGRA